MIGFIDKQNMISKEQSLPGRQEALPVQASHIVLGNPLKGPFRHPLETIVFGMGCFWGAERRFWQLDGVWSTAAGYAGGYTPNPTYEEVCSGMTGHTEVVLVVYDPGRISLQDLLKTFWEAHDPTQGMRQGNDRGTQYRSALYTTNPAQAQEVERSRENYNKALQEADYGPITTEVAPLEVFYYAEEYHQQYLARNPNGYCGLRGTGVPCQNA